MIEGAFSKDGYLINQSMLKEISYGKRGSHQNGCGWIAAYNFFKAAGKPLPWDTVRRQLEKSLLLGGVVGTNMWYLCWYLYRKGYRIHTAFTKIGADMDAAVCQAGILTYWTGKGIHFAAFVPEKAGRIRFFNAGNPDPDLTTMQEFFKSRVKFPLVFSMTTRHNRWERAHAVRRKQIFLPYFQEGGKRSAQIFYCKN